MCSNRTGLRPTRRWQTAGQIGRPLVPTGAGSPYAEPTLIGSHWGWQSLTTGSFHEMAARVLVHVKNGSFCEKPTGPHMGLAVPMWSPLAFTLGNVYKETTGSYLEWPPLPMGP